MISDDFTTKKDALEYFKNTMRNEEKYNHFWNLSNKYKEIEILVYLYKDYRVIKRAIVKKKEEAAK